LPLTNPQYIKPTSHDGVFPHHEKEYEPVIPEKSIAGQIIYFPVVSKLKQLLYLGLFESDIGAVVEVTVPLYPNPEQS
jgi:hypothetical protein